MNLSSITSGLPTFERLDTQRVMRWIVNLIACCCGLLTGALLWKVYILAVDKGVEVPTFEAPALQALKNPGWGPWIDIAQSRPPQVVAPRPAQQNPRVAPINTKIDLVGIIGYGNAGVAIMRVNSGQETVYNQGEEVDSGIVLQRIVINGVILSNGETEKGYYFPEIEGLVDSNIGEDFSDLPQASPIVRVDPAPKVVPLRPSNPQPAPAPQPLVTLTPETKQQIEELRSQPLNATKYADAEFVQRDGKLYGLRIGELRNPQLFQAIGLNRNDIVVSVNGIPVADLMQDPVGAQALLRERDFRLEVIRNGARQTVNFSWPQ